MAFYMLPVVVRALFFYRYSALGPVWAETRAQSVDWYSSDMLHPGQVLRGSLPLLSPNNVYNTILNNVTPTYLLLAKLFLCFVLL